jgi:hypothetical protein
VWTNSENAIIDEILMRAGGRKNTAPLVHKLYITAALAKRTAQPTADVWDHDVTQVGNRLKRINRDNKKNNTK